MPQALSNKLKLTGMSRLMPKTLALMAVQRQTAASRSTRPSMRLQQGVVGGLPILSFNKFNRFAHAPSFRASFGHLVGSDDGTAGDG